MMSPRAFSIPALRAAPRPWRLVQPVGLHIADRAGDFEGTVGGSAIDEDNFLAQLEHLKIQGHQALQGFFDSALFVESGHHDRNQVAERLQGDIDARLHDLLQFIQNESAGVAAFLVLPIAELDGLHRKAERGFVERNVTGHP